MSQWTHVNGNIRFDYLPISPGLGIIEELKSVFGEIISYDHVGFFGENHESCPSSNIPCGSEGSIEYDIHETPRGYDVSVWGDLRDFGDEDIKDIIEWFDNIMRHVFNAPFFVRDALIEVEVEYGKTYILRDWRDEKFDKTYRIDEIESLKL